MSENKIKFGLKNVHYAPLTETDGVITYGTPVKIPGAVNLSLSAAGDKVEFYADDGEYFAETVNNGYEGSLEMALIPDAYRIAILGETLDANGAIIENRNATMKKFALMFEFDGDAKKTRHVSYYVSGSRPNVESGTRTNSKEPKTESMDITSRPHPESGNVKAKVKEGTAGYDDFYTAVYVEDAATNTLTTITSAFSKAAPAVIEVDVTSTDVTNIVKNVLLGDANVGGAYLTVDGVDVDIESTVFAALDDGDYTITVEFDKGNAVTGVVTVGA
jgi:phi13 family phage major tail protein